MHATFVTLWLQVVQPLANLHETKWAQLNHILALFLTFSFICWFVNVGQKDKNNLPRIVNISSKVTGVTQSPITVLYEKQVVNEATRILADDTHMLHGEYFLLPSSRRIQTVTCKANRKRLSLIVKLLDNDISPSDSVRNLGVIFDSDFSFNKHISRDLRRIRRYLPLSTAKTISNSLITSRLDYCNSPINNIAKQDLSKFQRVQNCLARVVLRAPRFSPSLPLLKQLHWLPVNYRINFKLSTLTYRALAIHQPPYLASLLHFSNVPRQLRSSTSQQLSIPRTKLNLGKRAFSVAAPIIWNELPTTLKSCESLASFRKNLKTYLFKIAFPP